MNAIVRVTLILLKDGNWRVDVHKAFAPEHGGGTAVFSEHGGSNVHAALQVAREMVTFSLANRPAVETGQ
jgi:hypothetical protein